MPPWFTASSVIFKSAIRQFIIFSSGRDNLKSTLFLKRAHFLSGTNRMLPKKTPAKTKKASASKRTKMTAPKPVQLPPELEAKLAKYQYLGEDYFAMKHLSVAYFPGLGDNKELMDKAAWYFRKQVEQKRLASLVCQFYDTKSKHVLGGNKRYRSMEYSRGYIHIGHVNVAATVGEYLEQIVQILPVQGDYVKEQDPYTTPLNEREADSVDFDIICGAFGQYGVPAIFFNNYAMELNDDELKNCQLQELQLSLGIFIPAIETAPVATTRSEQP